MKRYAFALAGAVALLVALPWFALSRGPVAPPPAMRMDDRPIYPKPGAAIDAVLAREPFQVGGPPEEQAAEVAGDGDVHDGDQSPPDIVGIAGRLPDHAIVLVRRAAGGTRTLAVGEAVGRWRLESIAVDAALFSDGSHRVRVELPVADAPQ